MSKEKAKISPDNSKNDSLIIPKTSKSHIYLINRKLEKAEKSGFTSYSKLEILMEAKSRLS